jgi:hypothetical protein
MTIFQGLACLVALGIVEKAMAVYRKVGHTKNEVDQAGGVISRCIAPKTLLTPSIWLRMVEKSMSGRKKVCFTVKNAAFVHGCPDYSYLFRQFFGDPKLKGITRLQETRFAMSRTKEEVEFHVRSHALSKGWLPRYSFFCNKIIHVALTVCLTTCLIRLLYRAVIPAKEGFMCKHWKEVPEFIHPDEEAGDPVGVTAIPLDHVTAKRQDWLYTVRFYIYILLILPYEVLSCICVIGNLRIWSRASILAEV